MIIGPHYLDDVDMDDLDIDTMRDCLRDMDDILEFSDNNFERGVAKENSSGFQENSHFSRNINSNSALLAIPQEDIPQLKWLSNFVKTAISAGNDDSAVVKNSDNEMNKDSHHICTSNPTSILEGGSSSSGGKTSILLGPETLIPESARKKRSRICLMDPSTYNPHNVVGSTSSCYSVDEIPASVFLPPIEKVPESHPKKRLCFGETNIFFGKNPWKKVQNSENRISKKMKTKVAPAGKMVKPYVQSLQTDRKCTHCEITVTPIWRQGPSGPGTLCNACGVCYRKGRLIPEYRPRASPTYNPLIHVFKTSKVKKMNSGGQKNTTILVHTVESIKPLKESDSGRTSKLSEGDLEEEGVEEEYCSLQKGQHIPSATLDDPKSIIYGNTNSSSELPTTEIIQPDDETARKCECCIKISSSMCREGPSGPDTLCNACYKADRLRYLKGVQKTTESAIYEYMKPSRKPETRQKVNVSKKFVCLKHLGKAEPEVGQITSELVDNFVCWNHPRGLRPGSHAEEKLIYKSEQ